MKKFVVTYVSSKEVVVVVEAESREQAENSVIEAVQLDTIGHEANWEYTEDCCADEANDEEIVEYYVDTENGELRRKNK